jgi:hypothetical protein
VSLAQLQALSLLSRAAPCAYERSPAGQRLCLPDLLCKRNSSRCGRGPPAVDDHSTCQHCHRSRQQRQRLTARACVQTVARSGRFDFIKLDIEGEEKRILVDPPSVAVLCEAICIFMEVRPAPRLHRCVLGGRSEAVCSGRDSECARACATLQRADVQHTRARAQHDASHCTPVLLINGIAMRHAAALRGIACAKTCTTPQRTPVSAYACVAMKRSTSR